MHDQNVFHSIAGTLSEQDVASGSNTISAGGGNIEDVFRPPMQNGQNAT